jgi:adenylate kinase
VPDDVTEAMVRERLNHADLEDGFILDGFPRTLPQARALEDMLGDLSRSLAGALYLSVPDEEIIRRISGRRFCSTCQTTYHIEFNRPKQEDVCDHDGTRLIQRDDDAPETVRARLRIFHGQTVPVVEHYREAGLLIEVPAVGEVQEVAELIATMMQPFKRTV